MMEKIKISKDEVGLYEDAEESRFLLVERGREEELFCDYCDRRIDKDYWLCINGLLNFCLKCVEVEDGICVGEEGS